MIDYPYIHKCNKNINLICDHTYINKWGRSSFGRKGVTLGAGYIDPGFRGNLTLCMVNNGPEDITVTKGMRVVQMLIHAVEGKVESAYNGQYQDSHGVVESKL